jgi:hypothetical protein
MCAAERFASDPGTRASTPTSSPTPDSIPCAIIPKANEKAAAARNPDDRIEQREAILALSWCCKSCRLRAILALNRARVLDALRQFFEPRRLVLTARSSLTMRSCARSNQRGFFSSSRTSPCPPSVRTIVSSRLTPQSAAIA